ncbi:MAG: hypothetical protein KDE14_15725 [Rhodobacteraceae bacterium]|nr:hypothetical protein [Paracoccaceae bacterium]
MALTRDAYIKLIEQTYFGAVMAEKLDDVIACFTGDAEVTIHHGDNPVRRFFGTPQPGQDQLRVFWTHLFENYRSHFGGFNHVIDMGHECCACTFTATLTPKPQSSYVPTGVLTLNNCNFFWYRGDKIARMTIYYANPTLGAKLGTLTQTPTGFPKP